MRLEAASGGVFTGRVQFVNNDSDENPFNFTVNGVVEIQHIYLALILK